MIYLDNAATTKIDPRVLEAMMPYLTEEYGNAGTLYSKGRHAFEAVERARAQVARYINAEPDQIIFTSGGSEANNLAVKGIFDTMVNRDVSTYVSSVFEHDSLLNAMDDVTVHYGIHHQSAYPAEMIFDDPPGGTGFVSCMMVNNELGDHYYVNDICKTAHKHGALFHTDAVQCYGDPIDVEAIGCDSLSLSSHKIHGPKGAGALYVRDRTLMQPLINGGMVQEFGLRGGTENVAGIVGFGEACELMQEVDANKLEFLASIFFDTLNGALGSMWERLNVNSENFGKILNLRIDGIDAETLVLAMDTRGVCISAGSACTSHESNPSHVLTALGLTDDEARSSVRISFSRMNTEEEALDAGRVMAECAKALA